MFRRNQGSARITEAVRISYDHAMNEINKFPEETAKLALRILSWLLNAEQQLNYRQLRVGLSIKRNHYHLTEQDTIGMETILNIFLNAGFASLVVIDKRTKAIHLDDPKALGEYFRITGKANLLDEGRFEIIAACITYLSFDIFNKGICPTNMLLLSRYKTYPFFFYAAHNLCAHLHGYEEELSVNMILQFLERPGCVSSYTQTIYYRPSRPASFDAYPKQRDPLHTAVSLKHRMAVRALIKKGLNVSSQDSHGRTALHTAAFGGAQEIVHMLLKNGANQAVQDQHGWIPLHVAAFCGCKLIVLEMLENGANFEAVSHSGRTALHVAAFAGRLDAVRLLVETGSRLSAADNQMGWTALHEAALKGEGKIVWLLLELGDDVSALDRSGRTAMDLAMWRGEAGQAVVRIFEAASR